MFSFIGDQNRTKTSGTITGFLKIVDELPFGHLWFIIMLWC